MLNDAQMKEAWEALKDTPLIKAWTEFKTDYLPQLERVEQRPGALVAAEGDPVNALTIVGAGTLRGSLRRGPGDRPWLEWELRPGDCFGQATLYQNQPQFEVRAVTAAVLYRLRPFDLRRAIERNEKLQEFLLHQDRAGRLRRLPLLRTLDDGIILRIAGLVREVEVAANSEVGLTTEPGLFVIESGQVTVEGPAAMGRVGWRLTAGNFFVAAGGGEGRFGQNCVANRAVAHYKSRLFFFPAFLFNALANEFPDVRDLVRQPLDIASYLDSVEVLRNLTVRERHHLAQFCGWMFVPAGQNITTQGQPGYGLVMLRQGMAVILAVDDRGRPRPRNTLRAPAAYGETSLVEGREHDATVRSVPSAGTGDHPQLPGADILVLDRRDLNVAYEEDPQRFAAYGALLRRPIATKQARREFEWLQEGETVEWKDRSHWLWLVRPLASLFLAFLLLLLLVWVVPSDMRGEVAVALTIAFAFLFLPAALFITINYFDDYYVVTSRRVTRRDRLLLFYEGRVEIPLEMIQDATYDADFWGRLFDYGDVNIRSAARVGSVKFEHVPHPDRVRALIQRERAEATAGVRGQQQEELRKAVMTGLRLALPIPVVGRALGEAEATPARRSWFDRFRRRRRPRSGKLPALKGTLPGPFVRFANRLPESWRRLLIGEPAQVIELKEGEYLWRKHPIQLIIQAGRPLVMLLLWVAIGATLFRAEFGANWVALHLPWWVVFFFFVGWVSWEVADYRNDLYVLRDDRIIDIEATPFWLAIKRREAPLDRVQNVQARQEGFWKNLLNYGDVEILTAATDEGLSFSNIANPTFVQATIFQKLDAFRSRQAERQIRERQREIVEGLSVYHELHNGLERP